MRASDAGPEHMEPVLPVLYINLDRAPARRQHVEQQITRTFAPGTYAAHRIAGVDGARVDPDRLLISPYTRYILSDRSRASAHAQIEAWGAIGCLLSHVLCWEWLLAQPPDQTPHCLVLEDDACFPPDFVARVWDSPALRGLRAQSPHGPWDVLMLGYFNARGLQPLGAAAAGDVPLHTVRPGGVFYGTQAYLLTRRGAAILREHVFPLEIQSDAYILVLQQLGWLRVLLTRVVEQCAGSTEPGIQHGFREQQLCARLCGCGQWAAARGALDRAQGWVVLLAAVLSLGLGALAAVWLGRRRRRGRLTPAPQSPPR